jgi:hypothetical protein
MTIVMFFVAYELIKKYLSIDICLDNGGRWDYSEKLCVLKMGDLSNPIIVYREVSCATVQ